MGLLALVPILGEIIDKVIPDPEKRMELNLELAKLADADAARENERLLGQIEVNKVEASHRSLFIAGWRPFIGWGAGIALLYNTLVAPAVGLSVADLGFLQVVLLAILGVGGMRSFDKVKGTSNDTPLVVRNSVRPMDSQKPVKASKKVLPFNIPGL